jgi:hypothetical protein
MSTTCHGTEEVAEEEEEVVVVVVQQQQQQQQEEEEESVSLWNQGLSRIGILIGNNTAYKPPNTKPTQSKRR